MKREKRERSEAQPLSSTSDERIVAESFASKISRVLDLKRKEIQRELRPDVSWAAASTEPRKNCVKSFLENSMLFGKWDTSQEARL